MNENPSLQYVSVVETLRVIGQMASAYFENHTVSVDQVPVVIRMIHDTLATLGKPVEQPVETVALTPAQIRKSVRDDALVSFIDGKPYKSLKRHLTANGLDAAGYRQRFGLPGDYPMTAPAYSRQRSALARQSGLGLRAVDASEAA